MTDPDYWDLCPDNACPHPRYEHDILNGCTERDDLGNRCACKATP